MRLYSSINKVKKVLIHEPGIEVERLIPWYIEHPLTFDVEYTRNLAALRHEHQSLRKVLETEIGAENVLELTNLLQDILQEENQRIRILAEMLGSETLEKYVQGLRLFEGQNLDQRLPLEIAHDLIIGYPRHWLIDNESEIVTPIVLPKEGLRHMRDPFAVVQSGLILGAMQRLRRKNDSNVVGAVFKYHPAFNTQARFALQEDLDKQVSSQNLMSPIGFGLEGGNIQILSKDTIAIGISYAWSNANFDSVRLSFQYVVDRLFETDTEERIQRIYVVNVPNFQHFWHLDSVFNLLGPKSAIVMPYIFGYPEPPEFSLQRLIFRIAQDLLPTGNYPLYPYNLPTVEDLHFSGRTEVYLRQDYNKYGKATPVKQRAKRFLDQLEEDDLIDLDKIVWAGGNLADSPNIYEHIRVAFREQASQACNTFCLEPYNIIAVDQNPHTLFALERFLDHHQGKLHVVPGVEQVKAEAGPHCFVADIEREE